MRSGKTVRIAVGVCAGVVSVATWSAHGASQVFNINANGIKEVSAAGVPNQGDLDGTAVGTLTLNNGTGAGTTGTATFSLTLTNIDLTNLTGHHIHQAPFTTTGGIVVDFGEPDTIRTGSLLSGTVSNLPAATITNILANPSGFYYNLHNDPAFPSGAVRDQLPEPGVMSLLVFGGIGLMRRRRRTA